MSSTERVRFSSIEGARGFLALWVVIGHLLQKSFPGEKLLWPLSLLRDASRPVDIFIIISGFVIAHLIATKRESYAEFIVRRFFRIAPLLYVSMTAVVLLYALFPTWYGKYVENEPVWAHIAAHVVMLHGAIPQEVMKNAQFTLLSPAWSLSLEWQFYLVAPSLLILHKRPVILLAVLTGLVLGSDAIRPYLSAIGITLTGAFLPYSLKLFMIGIASYLAVRALRPQWRVAGLAIAAMLASYAFASSYTLSIWLLVLLSVCGDPLPRVVLQSRPALWLGKVSFSIYLLHMIAMTAGIGTLSILHLSPGTVGYFALLAVITFGVTIPASAVTYHWIERPGMEWGRRLGYLCRGHKIHDNGVDGNRLRQANETVKMPSTAS